MNRSDDVWKRVREAFVEAGVTVTSTSEHSGFLATDGRERFAIRVEPFTSQEPAGGIQYFVVSMSSPKKLHEKWPDTVDGIKDAVAEIKARCFSETEGGEA